MPANRGAAGLLTQTGTAGQSTTSAAESAYSVGRTQVIRRLLAQCLHDRELCRLMDEFRDGLIYRLPVLRRVS